VHDAPLVRLRQRGRHRGDGGDHLPRTQPAAPGQQCGQAAAGEEVQHERDLGRPAADLPPHHAVQPDEVGVVEVGQQRRLTHLAGRVAADEHLHRHRVATAPRTGPPHLTGTTPAEQLLQDVAGHHRGGGAGRAGRFDGHAGTVGRRAVRPPALSTGRGSVHSPPAREVPRRATT
jgi:hypothetical protein